MESDGAWNEILIGGSRHGSCYRTSAQVLPLALMNS